MIYINNNSFPFSGSKSLADLLTEVKIDADKGYAIAVNETIIPKKNWNEFMINKEDKIILIKATQGG